MKNNIRYKGNTNNTSVIIFFKKVKNSQRWYFAWENLRGGFCCIFIFISFLYLHFVVICRRFFIHIYFSTSSLTLPWTIAGFLHPIYTFSPAQCRVIRDTSIFQLFRDLLTVSATVLSGRFLPTYVFCLTPLHRHFWFNLRLSRLPVLELEVGQLDRQGSFVWVSISQTTWIDKSITPNCKQIGPNKCPAYRINLWGGSKAFPFLNIGII